MPRRLSLRPVFALLAIVGASSSGGLAAQEPKVPVQKLTKPDATFDEPFTQVVGLRELRNGDVIVADMRDRTLQKINLKTGTATALSREGASPTDVRLPHRCLCLSRRQHRHLRHGEPALPAARPDGETGDHVSDGRRQRRRRDDDLRAASGADNKGRLYYSTRGERRGGGMDGGPPEFSDSGQVVRYDRAAKKFDTLGVIMVPKPAVQASGSADNRSVSIRPVPMAPEDAWGVAFDGRIGVARVLTDEVQWWLPIGSASQARR